MVKKNQTRKIQANVEGYTFFVLDGLIDIYGRSNSDVVGFIVKSWIKENSKDIEGWGLGIKEYRKSKQGTRKK